ncbi:uncharacterized protein DS421_13g408480 [Arachis hypogaea]|nr:uncharacterized protein DS421_13g408480 [Arachis hypogaea]
MIQIKGTIEGSLYLLHFFQHNPLLSKSYSPHNGCSQMRRDQMICEEKQFNLHHTRKMPLVVQT